MKITDKLYIALRSQYDKFYDLFISSTPANVEVEDIDDDGNLITRNLTNLATVKKEFDDWKKQFSGLALGNNIGDVGYIRTFFTSDNNNYGDSAKFLHFVTDIKDTQTRTFCIKIQGQFLNEMMAVDTTIVGYMYGQRGLKHVDILNNQRDLFSLYINSNGLVTIKYTGNHYYASLRIETIVTGNGGVVTIPEIVLSKEDL